MFEDWRIHFDVRPESYQQAPADVQMTFIMASCGASRVVIEFVS